MLISIFDDMCGIAGIITRKGDQPHIGQIKKMTDLLRHRGPDGEGFYIDGNVGLGHRRLSIIDTSQAADQPFFYGDDLVLVFNGAIYNYLEIKNELIREGFVFSTESDTEVLLAAYKFWGEDCVQKFNGMWAFVIYDKRVQKLFCSRDRFGVKPFYYLLDKSRFIFSSEIKPILAINPVSQVNVEVLLSYLITNLSEQNEETFFEGILKLPAATNLSIDLKNDTYLFKKYYEIEYKKDIAALSFEDSVLYVENELKRSINYRLRADVKKGSALSGGLDSSFITYYAAKSYPHAKNHFSALSVGSVDKNNDESRYAKRVVDGLDIDHKLIFPDKTDFDAVIEDVIYLHEEPFAGTSVYMQYFLMRCAKENNIKVLLDGQGADEILLGYSRYIAAYIRTHSFISGVKFLFSLKKRYGISFCEGLRYYFYFSDYRVRIFRLLLRNYRLKKKFRDRLKFENLKSLAKSYRNLFELQTNELTWAQIPELLKWEDKNSMANSVETRLPYLDFQFVETCLSINNDYKLSNGWSKYLLRKIMQKEGVPKEVTWRRKKNGFESPHDKWWPLSNDVIKKIKESELLKTLLKNPSKISKDRDMQWRLYNIAVWADLYNMKISDEYAKDRK